MEEIIKKLNEIERKLDELAILNKETLTLKEAAMYLDISRSHLYKLTYRKEIPHYKPRGKQVYFERRELDKWLLQNRQTTKAEIEENRANDNQPCGEKMQAMKSYSHSSMTVSLIPKF